MLDIIMLLVACILFCSALLGVYVVMLGIISILERRNEQLNERIAVKIDYLHKG